MRRIAALLTLLVLTDLQLSRSALGTVFYSKEEAFELAFGKDAAVDEETLFLTDEQTAAIEKLAQAKLESPMFTFYRGHKGEQVLGYAAIESHTVRTQPETLLIVLSPQGELVRSEMLAFHEPPEYQPPGRWFERLYRRSLQELRLNQGVDGISGATLSSRAALDGIRKTMAVYRIALSTGKP